MKEWMDGWTLDNGDGEEGTEYVGPLYRSGWVVWERQSRDGESSSLRRAASFLTLWVAYGHRWDCVSSSTGLEAPGCLLRRCVPGLVWRCPWSPSLWLRSRIGLYKWALRVILSVPTLRTTDTRGQEEVRNRKDSHQRPSCKNLPRSLSDAILPGPTPQPLF